VANMCSIILTLEFKIKKDNDVFKKDFNSKMEMSKQKKEDGIKIAEEKYLFDISMDNESDESSTVVGWVKWALDPSSIKEFTNNYLKEMKVVSFECSYEELGTELYGMYIYNGIDIRDRFIGVKNPIWKDLDISDENFYDALDRTLEKDFNENKI